jgi:hypothetical protein
MTDEEDLDVGELESQFFDAGSNQRYIRFEIAVDEDVPLRRGDEIVREPFAADVVEISGDAKRRKRLGPFSVSLRQQAGNCRTESDQDRGERPAAALRA